ncbi:VOC family protein [Kribbella sp. NPDC051586]|uniref:VOC family protein n=1 Tax=Kribbella sp. NPDC051586 TaxID=3364118 RepID=UPI0037AADCB1
MAVEFNHTIVDCTDKEASARFVADILGLGEPSSYGPFAVVQLGNGASLDFADAHGRPHTQHYAFLVTEAEFDQIHARIVERDLPYWADPFHRRGREINTNDGGRGLYWNDLDDHNLEILTVPYGGWPSTRE